MVVAIGLFGLSVFEGYDAAFGEITAKSVLGFQTTYSIINFDIFVSDLWRYFQLWKWRFFL